MLHIYEGNGHFISFYDPGILPYIFSERRSQPKFDCTWWLWFMWMLTARLYSGCRILHVPARNRINNLPHLHYVSKFPSFSFIVIHLFCFISHMSTIVSGSVLYCPSFQVVSLLLGHDKRSLTLTRWQFLRKHQCIFAFSIIPRHTEMTYVTVHLEDRDPT